MSQQEIINNKLAAIFLSPKGAHMVMLQRIKAEAAAIAEARAKAEAEAKAEANAAAEAKAKATAEAAAMQERLYLEKERFKTSEALKKLNGFPGRTQNCEEEKATEEDKENLTFMSKIQRPTGSFSPFHGCHGKETWVTLKRSDGFIVEANEKDLVFIQEVHDENYPVWEHWRKMFVYSTGKYLFTSPQKIF